MGRDFRRVFVAITSLLRCEQAGFLQTRFVVVTRQNGRRRRRGQFGSV